MNCKLIGIAAVFGSIALSALAHSGATGIVKERMDGMSAMEEAVKNLAPMMRGQGQYDPNRVNDFAQLVQSHAGETMTKLFAEGTAGMPSVAKENIWTDWEEFAALAEQLSVYAEGLTLASGNGLADSDAGMMGGMMGGNSMTAGGGMMGSAPKAMTLEDIATMPADAVFTMIGQTCAACHTKFRAEAN